MGGAKQADAMKIYTKTGDAGETGLLGGDRVSKVSFRIESIGEVDELNAAIGLAVALAKESAKDELNSTIELLTWIQHRLFDLGSELACPPGGKFELESIRASHTEKLETSMDERDSHLEPLKNFILPGGSSVAAQLHFARSVCRRAERACLRLNQSEPIRTETLVFLNRLSDWLFCEARFVNSLLGLPDVIWIKEG